jgi:two-component sensor histidine kinase
MKFFFLFASTWCMYIYSPAQPTHSGVPPTDPNSFQELINRSIQSGNLDSQAIYLGNQALAYQKQNNFMKALEIYTRVIEIGKEVGDTTIIAGSILNTGMIYKDQGIYDKALENLLMASTFFEKLYAYNPNPLDGDDLASCYNSIGKMYQLLLQNRLALDYYQAGLMLRIESNDRHGVAGSLNFIGELYLNSNQYDSALFYLDSSLHIKYAIHDPLISTTLLNIGTVYLKMDKLPEAEQYFKRVVNNTLIDNTKSVKANAYYELASLYYKQKKFVESNACSDQSILYAFPLHLKPLILENYALKRKVYEQLHDLASVVHYDTLYIALKDSILNEQKNKDLVETQVRYQTDKKEEELISLNRLKNIEQLKVLILSISISLLVIIIALVLKGLYKEKKNRLHVQTLMKELNHRVKNNFQLLKSLLIIQKDKVIDARLKEEITSIENRLQAMIHIHRRLYQKDTLDAITSINLKTYIEDLLKDLRHSYGYEDGLTLHMELEEIHLHIDRAIPLGLMINEIISNVFKHAFTEVSHSVLIIDMHSINNKLFSIRIQDNGKGELTNQHIENGESYGLKLIRILSKQIHAEVQVKREHGIVYELTIKK